MIIGMDEFMGTPEFLFTESARRPSRRSAPTFAPPAVTLPLACAATLSAALTVGEPSTTEANARATHRAHFRWAQGPATETSSANLAEAISEIAAAGLPPMATLKAMALVQRIVSGVVPPQVEAFPIDDGGLTVEFTEPATGRHIWFAVSGDGARVPFVAKGPGGFRQSGILVADEAMAEVGRWLRDERIPFPSLGVELP